MFDCLIVTDFVVDLTDTAILIGCVFTVGVVVDPEDHIVSKPARHQRSLPLLVNHDVLHELRVVPRDVG